MRSALVRLSFHFKQTGAHFRKDGTCSTFHVSYSTLKPTKRDWTRPQKPLKVSGGLEEVFVVFLLDDAFRSDDAAKANEQDEEGAGREGFNQESHKTNLLIKKFMKRNEARTSCLDICDKKLCHKR